MRVSVAPEQVEAQFRQLEGRLLAELWAALERGRDLLKSAAVRFSSGPYSKAQLRRMGHPYARRHGRPRLDPGILNVQTGELRAGWQVQGPRREPDRLWVAIFNTDPKAAQYLEPGTARMFARPVASRVMDATRGQIDRLIAAAFERAFR